MPICNLVMSIFLDVLRNYTCKTKQPTCNGLGIIEVDKSIHNQQLQLNDVMIDVTRTLKI